MSIMRSFSFDSAQKVRLAFGEPEPRNPMKGNRFRDAMAKLESSILEKLTLKQHPDVVQESSNSNRKPEGLTFDKLPYDVKHIVFGMAQSMPSWVHFEFRNGQLVKSYGGSQEKYINRESYHNPQLQRNAVVKKRLDWFFFDGNADMRPEKRSWPMPRDLYGIRTCVFRLDELYDEMRLFGFGIDTAPLCIWPEHSEIEELVILIGDFRKLVPPTEMRELWSIRTNEVVREIIKGYPGPTNNLPKSQIYMMNRITHDLSATITRKREEREKWLRFCGPGSWLAYDVHDESNITSKWLATSEGHQWLASKGDNFLATESARWWLASDLGYPWLETGLGIQWLDTRAGTDFLASPQALLWANTGTYPGPRGRQVQKAWFNTPAGQTWKSYNCPNGIPPNSPQAPQRNSRRRPDIKIPPCFMNLNFRGWRFVTFPPEHAA
ncbi:hypothetical protein F4804DRAFT_349252 [Jackrogersella minutella]|nr:hypothetical protein F4804DRAFT_349252 [Jackrogersella minutella]